MCGLWRGKRQKSGWGMVEWRIGGQYFMLGVR